MKHISTTKNLFPSHSRETRLPKQEEETQNEQASVWTGFIPSVLGLWVECSTTIGGDIKSKKYLDKFIKRKLMGFSSTPCLIKLAILN
jgi:hypothetical protein